MPNDHYVRHILWSVFWYSTKKKTWVRKRFRDDFTGAMKFFKERDFKGITLHSDNMGFPPPLRIIEHQEDYFVRVTRKGKPMKKRMTRVVNKMNELNEHGVWWCPYCIKLRKFSLEQTMRGDEMYCPVCKISNYDFAVRKHNPKAIIVEAHKRQQRITNGKRRRRR